MSLSLPKSRIQGSMQKCILSDNETGELKWNRADRPEPLDPKSYYRRIGCAADGHCFFHAIAKTLSELYQLSYIESDTIDEKTLREFERAVYDSIRFPSELFDKPRSSDDRTVYRILAIDKWNKFQNLLNKFRSAYVVQMRKDLANLVSKNKHVEEIIKQRLSGMVDMYRKPTDKEDKAALQMVKDNLIEELLSDGPVTPTLMLIISEKLNVDIYLLRDKDLAGIGSATNPLYGGRSLHETILGPMSERNAVVLISVNDAHYEVVGKVTETKTLAGIGLIFTTVFDQDEPIVKRLYEMLDKNPTW